MNKNDGQEIYFLSVTDMTGQVEYDDPSTCRDYTSYNAAVQAARELARMLAISYVQCFCISVMGGERYTPSGDVCGDCFDIYTISSKTEGETMRARKLAHYTRLDVDEYTNQ